MALVINHKLIHEVAKLSRQIDGIKTWTELHRCDAKVRLLHALGLINEDTAGDMTDIIARADKRMKDEAKTERDEGDKNDEE